MQSTSKKIMVFGLAFSLIIGFGTLALAHGWRGHGPMMGYDNIQGGPGYNMGHGGKMGWAANLTPEQAAEVQRIREEFFRDSEPLRRQIFEKRAAYANELAKANPDKAKLSRIQKEVGKLQSDFNKLRLDFQLKVKKVVPNGFVPGLGRGFRHGYGPAGGMGPGYCWR